MNLRQAVGWSVVVHVAVTAALSGLPGLPRPLVPVPTEEGRELILNLVDPAWVPDSNVAPEEPSAAAGAGSGRGGVEQRGAPSSAGDSTVTAGAPGELAAGAASPRKLPDPAPESEAEPEPEPEREPQPEPGPESEPAGRTAGGAEVGVAPGLDSMAQRLGLDVAGLSDQARDRMFPVLYKYFLQRQQPTPSNYRQLLRTYVDAHMGYPRPVMPLLEANAEQRFLGVIEIAVGANGTFRLTDLYLYSDVADPTGTLNAYYRRILEDAATRPFIPPSQAGLPAPHNLNYRLVNPASQ